MMKSHADRLCMLVSSCYHFVWKFHSTILWCRETSSQKMWAHTFLQWRICCRSIVWQSCKWLHWARHNVGLDARCSNMWTVAIGRCHCCRSNLASSPLHMTGELILIFILILSDLIPRGFLTKILYPFSYLLCWSCMSFLSQSLWCDCFNYPWVKNANLEGAHYVIFSILSVLDALQLHVLFLTCVAASLRAVRLGESG